MGANEVAVKLIEAAERITIAAMQKGMMPHKVEAVADFFHEVHAQILKDHGPV